MRLGTVIAWLVALQPVSLLTNGGFEAGLSGWMGATDAQVTGAAAHEGAAGLLLPSAQLVTQGWIPVTIGRTYTLSAWFRWSVFSGDDWGIDQLSVINDGWEPEATLTRLHERYPVETWWKVGLSFVPRTAAVQVQFGVDGPQTSSVQWWDDVRLIEKTSNLPPTLAPVVTPTRGTAPLAVQVQTQADDPDGGIDLIQWEYGDGGRDNADTGSRTYQARGIYTPTVTVWDNDGAASTWATTVTVISEEHPSITEVTITDVPPPPPPVQPLAPVVTITQTPVTLPSVTTQVLWQHPGGADGIPVERFTYVLDGAAPVNVGLPLDTEGTPLATYAIPFPRAATPGTHTLVIQACNQAGCTDSDPVTAEVTRTDSPPSTPTLVMVSGSFGINPTTYTYNPTLVWFASADHGVTCPADRCIVGYRVEIAPAGTEIPLFTARVDRERVQSTNDIGLPWQISLRNLVPDGLAVGLSYVVRLVALGEGWESGRSEPSNLLRLNPCAAEGRSGVTPMAVTVSDWLGWAVGSFGTLRIGVVAVNPTHAVTVDLLGDGQPAWYFTVAEATPSQIYHLGPFKRAGRFELAVTVRDERGCEGSTPPGTWITIGR